MMDDDDWFATSNHTRTFFSADSAWMTRLCGRYSATHISKMVSPILSGSIDVVASPYAWVFNARQGAWWHAAAEPIISAGPLAFRRKFWSGGVHYPAVPLGEDVYFLWLLFSVGARVVYLKDTGSYVYVRHGCGNTWQMRLPNLRTADAPVWVANEPFFARGYRDIALESACNVQRRGELQGGNIFAYELPVGALPHQIDIAMRIARLSGLHRLALIASLCSNKPCHISLLTKQMVVHQPRLFRQQRALLDVTPSPDPSTDPSPDPSPDPTVRRAGDCWGSDCKT